jgi:hypothetical protein
VRFFLSDRSVLPRSPHFSLPHARFPARHLLAELGSTLFAMAPKRVTLEALVAERRFDKDNFRHRRALDESEPLADPLLEAARREAVEFRRFRDARVRAAEKLERFAELVEREHGAA